MAIESLISQIDAEIDRLMQAKKLLQGAAEVQTARKPGRKAKPADVTGKVKRVLSPEARKRIADAQKKRWAAQRKAK